MECDIKGIRKLVKRIRDGKPPAVAGDKFEDVYRDPALPGFGIRVLHTGAASWFVHYKRLGRQGKVTLGDVRVLDREQAVEAARDVMSWRRSSFASSIRRPPSARPCGPPR